VAPLPPPVVGPPAAPPGWYPDPWALAAVRWFDGSGWTGLVHGVPPPPPRAPVTTFPLRAGFLGFGVLLGALLGSAVVAGILYAIGVPEWFATVVVMAGGYLPVLAYVWWASRRWGTGRLTDDLGLRARPADLGWGPLTLVACWAAQIAVGILILALGLPVGSNTEGLFDDEGSWVVLGIIAVAAVVVAPVVEELLFRGLILRAFLSRMAAPAAVALQALLFGVVHLTPGIGLGNVSLVLALSAVGAVLGGAALLTRRLAAPMIAHAILNAVALTLVFLTG
jgi:uncharacterized protein